MRGMYGKVKDPSSTACWFWEVSYDSYIYMYIYDIYIYTYMYIYMIYIYIYMCVCVMVCHGNEEIKYSLSLPTSHNRTP